MVVRTMSYRLDYGEGIPGVVSRLKQGHKEIDKADENLKNRRKEKWKSSRRQLAGNSQDRDPPRCC
jgi:hypothetical protein